MKNQLLVIDGSSYIFRAFYGVRATLKNSQGLPTNAIFGFKNMLLQLLKQEDPSHCVMVFDRPGPSFRKEIYSEYKANRDAAPDDLKVQFEPIFELNRRLKIPLLWKDRYEADDLIGSVIKKFSGDIQVVIISGDKDLTQLVTDDVHMLDTMNNKRYTPETVKEKFGVPPELIAEYLAVIGDSSDNIPGASGIGPKTAKKLFSKYGSIQGIYQNTDQLKGKQKENIESAKSMVELSLKLTVIEQDIPIEHSLCDFERAHPDLESLKSFYLEMGFKPDEFLLNHPDADGDDLLNSKNQPKSLDVDSYELITETDRLEKLVKELIHHKEFAFDLETTSLLAVEANIVGISFCLKNTPAVYIPVGHTDNSPQIPIARALEILKPVFANPELTFIGQNIKYDIMVLANYGIVIEGTIQDTMIQSYILEANLHRHNLDELADRHLGHRMIAYEDVAGKGKNQISFADVKVDQALRYGAEDTDATLKVYDILSPRVKTENLSELYETIELPLCRVLAKMETRGVKLDVPYLAELCDGLNDDLDGLRQTIYEQAGEEFNINSTQQLGAILFDKMGITAGKKKTKTGYSTNAAVLEQIARVEPIARDILEYRTKNKLVNTYLSVLPTLISQKTGRVHTSYSQTVAATGRLSSNNPNLQNIPIRGEDGRKIRKAFIPEKEGVIISADYSQIELRFLAHLSEDANLIKVFQSNGDIHTETAAGIYGVTIDQVTAAHRQAAKAINFGIIYGMGAFRLSQEIGVTNKEAKWFIEAYFERYPKIRTYMDETIAFCKENAFVETMFKRKRVIPDIHSKNRIAQTAAERVAVNTRIQGSAADLIKIAMIQIQEELEDRFPNASMIMQVHDELVFEARKPDVSALIEMVKQKMETAVTLQVPLVVDIGFGENWQEAH